MFRINNEQLAYMKEKEKEFDKLKAESRAQQAERGRATKESSRNLARGNLDGTGIFERRILPIRQYEQTPFVLKKHI
ncbi:MAG TPA: hypothetical protein DD706_21865 [Nitrospiraceae bacterium]|nr:hypothetical protein [Nitrospiraceae bacterium]